MASGWSREPDDPTFDVDRRAGRDALLGGVGAGCGALCALSFPLPFFLLSDALHSGLPVALGLAATFSPGPIASIAFGRRALDATRWPLQAAGLVAMGLGAVELLLLALWGWALPGTRLWAIG